MGDNILPQNALKELLLIMQILIQGTQSRRYKLIKVIQTVI